MKPGFIPKSSKTYPLSPKETNTVKVFLDEHIAKDFIQPSKSLQASRFFFIGKKDGSLWPCQDYHYINEWMIKDAYSLLLIPPLITKLHNAKYFTKMNVRSGYNNILIHPDDCWKAAFTTSFGLLNQKSCSLAYAIPQPCSKPTWTRPSRKKLPKDGWLSIWIIFLYSRKLLKKTRNEPAKSLKLSVKKPFPETRKMHLRCTRSWLPQNNYLPWASSPWTPPNCLASANGRFPLPLKKSDHSLDSATSTATSSPTTPTSHNP